jgi:L-asparaginase
MGKSKILIVYTGGTIGSFIDPETDSLKPVNFEKLVDFIPELQQVNAEVTVHTLDEPKDSSNMLPSDWIKIAKIIEAEYHHFDGFVVLHGTDTMAYSASAVSFLIENLKKPVIFTGSQIPLGLIRTDAKENIITAIEIASAKTKDGLPRVPEVSIYFEFKLYRANRTFKFSTSQFNAYMSPNYSLLAEAGVKIEYMDHAIEPIHQGETKFYDKLDPHVVVLKIFPGITQAVVEAMSNIADLKAIILETFGAGNATLEPWFFNWMESTKNKGIIIVNITQCIQGTVEQGKYETGAAFKKLGTLSGADMTLEATVTKLMFLLGIESDKTKVEEQFIKSIRGERTAQ